MTEFKSGIFDVCIPTFNSLPYLKLCVNGIRKNSEFIHNILIHDNGSTDGTLDWLIENDMDYSHSDTNEGFCGINHALRRAECEHVMMMNADMIPLPGWDIEILKQIKTFARHDIDKYTISSCLIEPFGNNPIYDIIDCGRDYVSYDENQLMNTYRTHRTRFMSRPDTVQYAHPIVIPRKMLVEMNYLDTSYFPGWTVDYDMIMCAYKSGCRHFVMLGKSRAYHFISKTFRQLPQHVQDMHGQDIFYNKWGITTEQFKEMIGTNRAYSI